jgi:hypothetical protein
MATQIKLRRDTAANWLLEDPVLGTGEPGFELTTGKLKIGDGTSLWSALDYIVAEPDGSIDLGAVDKNLLPATGNTYDLGSPAKRWRHLFASGGSVYVGDIKLSNSSGTLVVQQVTNAGLINEAPVAGPGVVTTDRISNGIHSFSINASGVLQLDGAPYFGGDTALPTNTLGYLYNDGTGTLTWASGAGGAGGGTSDRLTNGAYEVILGATGEVSFPNGDLKIAGNKISNYVTTEFGGSGSQLEVSQSKTVITNGVATTLGGGSLTSQALFEVSTNGILSAFQVINTLDDTSLTNEVLTELDNTGFKIGLRVTNDLGGGEPLIGFNGWTFGTVNQQQALSYPNNAIQRDTGTVDCLGNASTVVYTASSDIQYTIKLLIQVEGFEGAAAATDSQACEMIVTKSFRADDIASSVYAVVHTSVSPLATFTAEWNALTSRIQVLCATPSANAVNVRIFATEIQYAP